MAELDVFAEHKLANKELPEAMRLIEEHLERCDDCREEFVSLLAALRMLEGQE
ncbi:MAG TPA: hypothetical protein VLE25_14940 [Nitrospira sp.]|nr:hypothetical protein [Nitrospira sp.]